MIIKLFILFLIFIVIIVTLRKQEQFTLLLSNPILNNTNYGIHSVVNPNNYHLKYYGPKCLNTCILEHVQKVNFSEALQNGSKYAKENILQYNRDHPHGNYCHSANKPIEQGSHIKNCVGEDCSNSCGQDNYIHCKKRGQFCSETDVNYLSGSAVLNKTKCGGDSNSCVDKYWNNIKSIKDIYDKNID
jgi:hypothetical protein